MTDKAPALQVRRPSRSTKASIIPSLNGRATMFTPTRSKAYFPILKRGLIGVYQHVDKQAS